MKRLNILVSIAISFSVLFSCTKLQSQEEITAAFEQVQWLKSEKNSYEQSCNNPCRIYVAQATWKGETVFEVGTNGPACFGATFVYDRNKKLLNTTDELYKDYLANQKNRKIIFTCTTPSN